MVANMQWATPEERRTLGQARRKQVGRQQHDELNIKARTAPALTLLERAERGRLPVLIKLKHQMMAQSPFIYFRGAAPVMAADLALVPNTGIGSQLCGDAHVRNLGAYAAPDGRLVFDINDFDETIVGPFEWDVKRMATSLILAGRGAGARNMDCREAAAVFLESYRTTMAGFARMPVLEVARYQVHRLQNMTAMEGILRMAERATPMHTLLTLTDIEGGETPVAKKKGVKKVAKNKVASPGRVKRAPRVFKMDPPKLTRVRGEIAEQVVNSLMKYAESLQPERRHFLAQYR